MPSLFIGPMGQYIHTQGPMSQTHRIDGKLHIFFKKITEEEARKRVAEKRAKEATEKEAEKRAKEATEKEAEKRAKEATEKKAKGPTVEAKKSKTAGVGTVEDYLENVLTIYAIEEGLTNDNDYKKWIEKITDKGDYSEYLESAIEYLGGHSQVANTIYKNLLKKGYSKASILDVFREKQGDGYTMFDEFIN